MVIPMWPFLLTCGYPARKANSPLSAKASLYHSNLRIANIMWVIYGGVMSSTLWSAINLVVLLFCSPFTLPLSPAGIRDADRLRRGFPPLGDHAEYGDPKFLALECLRRIRECRAPSWSGGGLDCNECPNA